MSRLTLMAIVLAGALYACVACYYFYRAEWLIWAGFALSIPMVWVGLKVQRRRFHG